MLSRVAENLYWISRYVERAENIARLLDVGFHLDLDSADLGGNGADPGPIDGVLTILACRDSYTQLIGPDIADRDAIVRFLTLDRRHDNSVVSMISRARENARATQESLSGEAWSQINALYFYLTSKKAERGFAVSPPRFFERIKRACVLFSGLIENTLPRTEAYHFLQLGRYLERANQIARILNVQIHGPLGMELGIVKWSTLLQTCSASEAYLRQQSDRIDPEGVVRYLVLDPDFPRTIRFCVARCCESLNAIAERDGTADFLPEAERRLGRLDSELRFAGLDEIVKQGLDRFLLGVQQACNTIATEIHHAYFFS